MPLVSFITFPFADGKITVPISELNNGQFMKNDIDRLKAIYVASHIRIQ